MGQVSGKFKVLLLSVSACLLCACASPGKQHEEQSLYEKLGGEAGVNKLTSDMIREIAADDHIRGHYKDTDIGRFHTMMQLQMCEKTGGGCIYTGDDMRRVHGGMNIKKSEFNSLVEAMMRAMDKNNIPISTQNQMLEIYAPMRADIIGH